MRNINSNPTFNIESTDTQGNIIQKKITVNTSSSNTVITTDKTKYNQNDDINIGIIGGTEWLPRNIFICKGNNLLKTLKIDEDNTSVNLGDTVGLIDIYLENSYYNSSERFYDTYDNYNNDTSYNSYIKKTIFIKPNSGLGIDIKTDKEEYSPKEKLNLEFNVSNENGNSVDSNLLVSILDEAVLSLADNDLSIDNIKLALEDIEFSDDITLADVYAEVLDNSASLKLDTLLLRQNSNNIYLNNSRYSNKYDKEDYLNRAIILGAILLIVITIIVLRLKKIKIADAIYAFVICLVITLLCSFVFYNILDYFDLINYDNELTIGIIILIISFILSIILYVTVLRKCNKKSLKKHIMILIVLPIIWSIIFGIIYDISDYEDSSILMVVVMVIISWIILTVAATNDGLGKKGKQIRKLIGQSIIGVGFWTITYYLMDSFGSISLICTFIIYILLNTYIFNGKTNKKIVEDGKIVIKPETILVAFGLIVAFAVLIWILLFKSYNSTINDALIDSRIEGNYKTRKDSNNSSSTSSTNDTWTQDDVFDVTRFKENAKDSSGAASASSDFTTIFDGSIGDKISDIFGSSKDESTSNNSVYEEENYTVYEEDSSNTEIAVADNKDEKIEENIRNVFLESLAFIPDVITENGKSNLSLDISDNITTWNIQVVGNSKDGKLGSSSKTFKVFKEFFVDFSLPTNSVVGDYVEIPVTLYNYTEGDLSVELNVKENEWSKIGTFEKTVNVPAKSTNMVYVPIEILKSGNQKLRVESKANGINDIVEKSLNVNYKGLNKTTVESVGSIEKDFTQDIIFNDNAIEGSKKIKVRLFPTSATEIINGMENILKMPTGCFEQTSSSLYPDILVLKYLQENDLDNDVIKAKALDYISKGYQKLLTYEVKGEKGGYSLYGNSPAEPVITAFGLMEFKELSEVYEVDQNVINNMKEYLYKNQKTTGEFDYNSTYIGTAQKTDKYAMNSYIIWALSEADPKDTRLEKSIKYLEKNLDTISDDYTLALIANVFANTSNKNLNEVIQRLSNDIKVNEKGSSYLLSNTVDYYGSYGKYQNIQATALTSIALSKANKDAKANQELINYIISSKDNYGTWGTTQATILSLKAINDFNKKAKIKEQKITVSMNGEEQSADVKSEALDIYEFIFDNVQDENTVKIGMKEGNISYEIIKDYYQEYSDVTPQAEYLVTQELNSSLNVNDTITQNITITNNSNKTVANGIVKINIPQGCIVDEDSLLHMKYSELIEKYEYNYSTINIYIRDFKESDSIPLQIKYRAMYPERVTGGLIEFYDYYNPETEGIALPVGITVNK